MFIKLTICSSIGLIAMGDIWSGVDSQQRRYADAITTLNAAKDEYSRWCALDAAAKESFNAKRYVDARRYAEELERLTPKYRNDWNYGNAIQDFNIVLGRLALNSGNVAVAKVRLLAAGHSPGSPQLDSFGPNLALANELLVKGEHAAVIEYLDLCRNFWAKHPDTVLVDKKNGEKLDRWKADIEQGRLPDFGPNLDY